MYLVSFFKLNQFNHHLTVICCLLFTVISAQLNDDHQINISKRSSNETHENQRLPAIESDEDEFHKELLARLGELPQDFNLNKLGQTIEPRNSISAPDFQANSAGFVLPDYLTNSGSGSGSSSLNDYSGSASNTLQKLLQAGKSSVYDSSASSSNQNNAATNSEELNSYLSEKNGQNGPINSSGFLSSNLRDRRKNPALNFGLYDRVVEEQHIFDPVVTKHLLKQQQQQQQQQNRDNEFASNSLLESVSSPIDTQDFSFNNYPNSFSTANDYGSAASAFNNDFSALNSYGLRNLGLSSPSIGLGSMGTINSFNGALGGSSLSNLASLTGASSSLVGTLGNLNNVVPPGAIVGAPGSAPPPGMKLAGYVTVTNPSPNGALPAGSLPSASNLLPTQQQYFLNQVMNRSPQAQALAQVMAQSMAQGVRMPFLSNPYSAGSSLQQLLNSGAATGYNPLAPTVATPANNSSSNQPSNEQQTSASNNRAKFLQRLNPLNLFRRLRTRNQKNNTKNNSNNSGNNSGTSSSGSNGLDSSSNLIPDLEERSQYLFGPEFIIQKPSQAQLNAQQQLAQQLSAQLSQLNMQMAVAQQNNPKMLRKIGSGSKRIVKRNVHEPSANGSTDQLQLILDDQPQEAKKEQLTSDHNQITGSNNNKTNNINETETDLKLFTIKMQFNNSDTETAENGFFPVADYHMMNKFAIRPRFRFPAREQRRVSNGNLNLSPNNFLASSTNKNFIGIMGSGNFEVIRGGMFTTDRKEENSMHIHGSHQHPHPGHHLPHHHNQQRQMTITPALNANLKPSKFNLDNDFDDEDEDDEDAGFSSSLAGSSPNQRQMNSNTALFLEDDLFGGSGQSSGQSLSKNSLNSLNAGGILGFQGFNSFPGSTNFNTLSSASSTLDGKLDNRSENDTKPTAFNNSAVTDKPIVSKSN